MSSLGAVAERYAQAIFELGVESGNLESLASSFTAFAATYRGSPELQAALSNPLFTRADRQKVLTQVAERLKVPALGVRALLVMAARRKLPAIAETAARLNQLFDEKEGVVRAQVTTALPMPESYYVTLTSQREKATRRRVVLERDVDSDLVAGAVARLGDAIIDASVRGRLNRFEHEVLSALSAQTL
jgi:F-type H+-transporting ATPase subunit delta